MNRVNAVALIDELATHGTVEVRALASALMVLFQEELYEFGYQFKGHTGRTITYPMATRESAERNISDCVEDGMRLVWRRRDKGYDVDQGWKPVGD